MADSRFAFAKLNGTNWQTWKVRVEMLLQREDLWTVVSEPFPLEEGRDDEWRNADRKAKATLVLLLEDSQLSLIKNCTSAHEVFNALKSYHQKTTRSVRVSLLKKLCAVNLPERGNLEEHLREIDDLFDRLDAAGTELDKDTKVCMLLRSLPPSFDGIVAALDSREDDDISLDIVKSKLMDEYHRRLEREGVGTGSKSEKAMQSVNNKSKESRVCHFCKRAGHLRRDCRKFKAQKAESGAEKETPKAKAAQGDGRSVAFTGSESVRSSSWVIDSGASAHMTNNREFFESLSDFSGGWITLADGQKTKILGEGYGMLRGVDGSGNTVKIDMQNVKFVPGLSTSLISVAKLGEKNLAVNFDGEGCRIADAGGDVVATGYRYGGLYYLRTVEVSNKAAAGEHHENCQHQWHRRFGHRDWAAAERLFKEKLATGVKVGDCGMRLVCECCLEGKSARQPFPPVAERKSKRILDIVHTDLCGPMKTTTPSGNRFVMHLIDDYSRFTVTYLLKHKSEAAQIIKDYVRWTQNVFGRKPGAIRSDGGGEFCNNDLKSFYRAEGIMAQFTTPYTPQQNGVAERKNRSITEMATCMMIDSGMNERYWGEAVLTATYLQNRLPSRSVPKTPYELWWGRKPDLSHLRIFGSEAYVHVPDQKRGKLEGKSKKLRFVGYSMDHKAYRFVNCETDLITLSRDARFVELGNGTSSSDIPLKFETHGEQRATVKEDNDPLKLEDEEKLVPEAEEEVQEEKSVQVEPVRRSQRQTRGMPPRNLDDYVLDYAVGNMACASEEPINVLEALKIEEWRNAMEDELDSHKRNQTWELVQLPKGKKVVGSRWVYKLKRDENGNIVKHKARVVAQGFAQKFGEDVEDAFASVARHATFRIVLTIAPSGRWL